MATGALNAQGVWIYGEDDSETTFSALLNKLGNSVSTAITGRIRQVVSSSITSGVSTTSGTYVNSGLSATITPESNTSKILVIISCSTEIPSGAALAGTIFRDSTNLAVTADWGFGYVYPSSTILGSNFNINYQDNPATTSAVTYSFRIRSFTGATVNANKNGSVATITLLEVGQ